MITNSCNLINWSFPLTFLRGSSVPVLPDGQSTVHSIGYTRDDEQQSQHYTDSHIIAAAVHHKTKGRATRHDAVQSQESVDDTLEQGPLDGRLLEEVAHQ